MGFLAKIGTGFRKTSDFFRDGWMELKKVRWPGRKELTSFTIVVLVVVTLITIFFAIIDLLISQVLNLILG
ncbi:preprotein translocase subunit SecE [Microaerobacter geothermalis]|uniref:preprotein translocase subunit SecE n=1 Tax=Microaerobacter geothermalis TaxID=674972 RepID=UPI001F2F23D0|nr:preprotein translocase subunit SecE [Microaerobacter geothermalis]MCF6094783.1 preprotein translocase subunit SecE [Microaerobacter geothermalis]